MEKYWLKSSTYTFLSNGLVLILAFFTFLVLVRVMPQEEFGIWVLYLTVTTFTEIMRNGITQTALVKHVAESNKTEYRSIVTASLFINLTTGIAGFLIIAGLAPFLSQMWNIPILKNILLLYGIYILFYMPLAFMEFLCVANLDFKTRFYGILTYYASNFIIVCALVLFKNKIEIYELPLIQAVAALLGFILILKYGRPYFKLKLPIDWKWVSKLFHYGKFVFATSFSSMLFNRTDLMMIGYFLNPVAVAIYNIPTRIGNYVEVPMNAITSVVFPKAAQRQKEIGLDATRYLYERSVGAMLTIIVPAAIILAVFAKPIVLLIAGEKYLGAVPVLRLFALASFIKPFGRQGGTILDSIGYPNYNFYFLVLSLVINFGLNWVFIVHYGIIGAIIATILAIVIGTLILLILLIKIIHIKIHHPFIYMWLFYYDAFNKVKNFIRSRYPKKNII